MRKIKVFGIAMFLIFAACLGWLLFSVNEFSANSPCLEIVFNETETAQSFAAAYTEYKTERKDNIITILSDDALLCAEIKYILSSEGIAGYTILDNTQAVRLAKQAVTLLLFFSYIIFFASIVYIIIKQFFFYISFTKENLQRRYFGEILLENSDRLFTQAAIWFVLLFLAVVLIIQIDSTHFFLPREYLPPEYILDLAYYASNGSRAFAITAYSFTCSENLPKFYASAIILSAAEIFFVAKISRYYIKKSCVPSY